MADIALEQLLHTAGDNTLGTTDGALHSYMRGTDGTTTRTVKTDADGNIVISPGLGTEATLAAVKAVLDSLDGKVATDAKLEAARALLASLDGKDYATQTTLAAVLAKLADPATSAKQDAAKVVLDAISTAVAARATEATLAQIKTALTDGSLKAQLSGSYAKLGAEHIEARFDQSIAAGAGITPVSIAKPIAIQGLSIYTNGTLVDKMFVAPSIRKANGTWQIVGSYGWGDGFRLDTPYSMGHHWFEAYKWDTSSQNYMIGLRSAAAPLVCSFGFQLKIDNLDTVERSVVVQINYRQLEV